MFFVNPDYWTAAFVAQRRFWLGQENNKPDRILVVEMMNSDTWQRAVWQMAGLYGVARSFPTDIRARVEAILSGVTVKNFDQFVIQVRQCARRIQSLERAEKTRRVYAVSGVSKILWHRFPLHGFIFDDQARLALSMNGLVAPFFGKTEVWGGPAEPMFQGDRELLAFAAAYQRFCLPMYAHIEKHLRIEPGSDAIPSEEKISSIRVVDKLLWLAGEDDKQRDGKLAHFNRLASLEDRGVGRVLADTAQSLLTRDLAAV